MDHDWKEAEGKRWFICTKCGEKSLFRSYGGYQNCQGKKQ